MPRQTRRVITGRDECRKAFVVEDANTQNAKMRSAANLTSTLARVTDEASGWKAARA